MPIDFQQAYKEALASAQEDITFTDTLTISHPTFPAPFRFARADKDVTLAGNVYIGRQFSMTLPQLKAKSAGGIQITITDIDFSVGATLDAAVSSLTPITILYQGFISTESTVQAEFSAPLEATRIAINGRTLVLTGTYPDLINKKIPSQEYTSNNFPGLRT
jgi:hypothetical protein